MNDPSPRPFEALRLPGFRAFLVTFMLTMMADNIEHVMSYWVVFSEVPFLGARGLCGGFALAAVPRVLRARGALNDRFDSRRLIQAGALLFMTVSLGWGYFFVTGTLRCGMPWSCSCCMAARVFSGSRRVRCCSIDVVGQSKIASAVRLNATARYPGMLAGQEWAA